MAAAGALGSAPALLTRSCLRLCFVTRSQALDLEPLEATLLKEAGEGAPRDEHQGRAARGGGGSGGQRSIRVSAGSPFSAPSATPKPTPILQAARSRRPLHQFCAPASCRARLYECALTTPTGLTASPAPS